MWQAVVRSSTWFLALAVVLLVFMALNLISGDLLNAGSDALVALLLLYAALKG